MQIRIEKSLLPRWWIRPLILCLSVLLALIIGAIILALHGIPPLEAYAQMFGGAFCTAYGLSEILVKAIPLMLIGLGVGIAFRMVLWNIGAEGQYCMGAIFACAVALFVPPSKMLVPLMLAAGFLGGALWGLIPGALKAFLGTNEIITTLMMNYIAIYALNFLVYGPWKDPGGYKFPMTAVIPESARLAQFWTTRVHLGLVFAVALILLFHIIMSKTRWGYEIRILGENPEAARYAGINITRNILLVMLVSGGIAGISGMFELAGIQHRLQHGFNLGYGYTAIIIAWLAKRNPASTILVACLFAGLMLSGELLQIAVPGVGKGMGDLLQGLILFFVLAGDLFTEYRLVIKRGGAPISGEAPA